MPYDWKTGINSQFHGLVLSIRLSADPNHGWYYLLIFSAIQPDSIPAISPATQPTTQPRSDEPLAPVSAKLMGTPTDIRGAEVHVPSAGMGEVDFLQPQNLTLTLPDEHQISIRARSSNVMFFDGIAHGVYVRLPMKSVPFKEAKDDLMRTLSDLHIELDDSTKTTMALWPEDAENKRRPLPELEDYQAGFAKSIHGAILTVRLCPDPKGGWYYLLIFSVGAEAK